MKNNLILCGLPMCGKTTIGKKLAAQLKWSFVDTDHLIEQQYKNQTGEACSCRQIFQANGEPFFRLLEKQQIASLNGIHHHVVAIGGGACQDLHNVQQLQVIGLLAYLKTSADCLWKRLKAKGIPAYLDAACPEEAFYQLVDRRIPAYTVAATWTIETDGLDEDQVVEAILQRMINGE